MMDSTVPLIGEELEGVIGAVTGIGQKENGVLTREVKTQICDEGSSTAVNDSEKAVMLEGFSQDNL